LHPAAPSLACYYSATMAWNPTAVDITLCVGWKILIGNHANLLRKVLPAVETVKSLTGFLWVDQYFRENFSNTFEVPRSGGFRRPSSGWQSYFQPFLAENCDGGMIEIKEVSAAEG